MEEDRCPDLESCILQTVDSYITQYWDNHIKVRWPELEESLINIVDVKNYHGYKEYLLKYRIPSIEHKIIHESEIGYLYMKQHNLMEHKEGPFVIGFKEIKLLTQDDAVLLSKYVNNPYVAM
jgi:hypothetical protein